MYQSGCHWWCGCRQSNEVPSENISLHVTLQRPTLETLQALRETLDVLTEECQTRQRELSTLRERISYMTSKLQLEWDIAPLTLAGEEDESLSRTKLRDVCAVSTIYVSGSNSH